MEAVNRLQSELGQFLQKIEGRAGGEAVVELLGALLEFVELHGARGVRIAVIYQAVASSMSLPKLHRAMNMLVELGLVRLREDDTYHPAI